MSVKGPPRDDGNVQYYYEWDPTKPVPCPGSGHEDVAVCQRLRKKYREGDIEFNAGSLTPRFFLADYNYFAPNTNFSVTYPAAQVGRGIDGEGLRISTVHFVVTDDHPSTPPTIEMLGELKYTEYSFLVKGPCLGQPPAAYPDPCAKK